MPPGQKPLRADPAHNPRPGKGRSRGRASSAWTSLWRRRKGGGKKGGDDWRARLGRWAVLVLIWGSVATGGLLVWALWDMPSLNGLYTIERRPSVTLVSEKGEVIATYGDLYGDPVRLDSLPQHLPQAAIAIEDRRFYSHIGIDPIGIARAFVRAYQAGRFTQGGSTITQQVAKNVFLTPARTVKRKLQEALLALWLERQFTKDQILELYLNRVYFGAGAYGVEAAAQRYFAKPAAKLTLEESAMLIGLLQAPSRLSPMSNLERAQDRARLVILSMHEVGFITDAERDAALAKPAQLAKSRTPMHNARYFADWVMDHFSRYTEGQTGDLVIVTTIDPGLQQAAERAVEKILEERGTEAQAGQAALVALSPDGAVRAMVGGRDYRESPFNRATQARRQPGSAFKLFVYLAALEAGLTPEDLMFDEPVTVDGWTPRNSGGQHYGEMNLRDAFAQSINTIAVTISEEVGRDNVIKVAQRLGITAPIAPHPSLALGAMEIQMLEFTGAYAALANGGRSALPYGVLRIETRAKEVLYERGPSDDRQLISPSVVASMNDMMSAVMEYGTGRAARIERAAAGKTGTSNEFRDAWFMGYTGNLVAGVWVGNDDNSSMNRVAGGSLPAVIWRAFMQDALRNKPVLDLPRYVAPPEPPPSLINAPAGDDDASGLWQRILNQFGGANAGQTTEPGAAPSPGRN